MRISDWKEKKEDWKEKDFGCRIAEKAMVSDIYQVMTQQTELLKE